MRILISFVVLIASACGAVETPAPAEGAEFHARLLEAAAMYSKFQRLNEASRWAPLLCGIPSPILPVFSKSKEKETHGQKLYFLFAKDPLAYLSLGVEKVPGASAYKPAPELKAGATEQIVVKEAWLPKEVDIQKAGEIALDEKRTTSGRNGFGGFSPYGVKDGKTYHAETKAALFIMMKLDAKTPGTDEGWVYGTVSPDAKTVTSAGRVSSCMECHKDAPHGRLFGLPKGKE